MGNTTMDKEGPGVRLGTCTIRRQSGPCGAEHAAAHRTHHTDSRRSPGSPDDNAARGPRVQHPLRRGLVRNMSPNEKNSLLMFRLSRSRASDPIRDAEADCRAWRSPRQAINSSRHNRNGRLDRVLVAACARLRNETCDECPRSYVVLSWLPFFGAD